MWPMDMPLSNGKDTGCSGRNDFCSKDSKVLSRLLICTAITLIKLQSILWVSACQLFKLFIFPVSYTKIRQNWTTTYIQSWHVLFFTAREKEPNNTLYLMQWQTVTVAGNVNNKLIMICSMDASYKKSTNSYYSPLFFFRSMKLLSL